MTADQLLDHAREVYRRGSNVYRDCLLETGKLLHEFVLARLQELDHLPRKQRPKIRGEKGSHTHRASVIKEAANALGVSPVAVNGWIATSMAVELLGGNSPIGILGHASIRRMSIFCYKLTMESENDPLSRQETWAIKPGWEEKGPAFFKRAAADGMTQNDVFEEIRRLFPDEESPFRRSKTPARTKKLLREAGEAMPTIIAAARVASPGDVSEMCMRLVEKAELPKEVALRLKAKLEEFLNRKPAWKNAM